MAKSVADNRGRLSLQFNLNDDSQKFAYEILKAQGHRKSVLISEALKFYMENNEKAPYVRATVNSFHSYQAKEMLRLALEETGPEGLASILSLMDAKTPKSSPAVSPNLSKAVPVSEEPSQIIKEHPSVVKPVEVPPKKEEPAPEDTTSDEDAAAALFDALDMFG